MFTRQLYVMKPHPFLKYGIKCKFCKHINSLYTSVWLWKCTVTERFLCCVLWLIIPLYGAVFLQEKCQVTLDWVIRRIAHGIIVLADTTTCDVVPKTPSTQPNAEDMKAVSLLLKIHWITSLVWVKGHTIRACAWERGYWITLLPQAYI